MNKITENENRVLELHDKFIEFLEQTLKCIRFIKTSEFKNQVHSLPPLDIALLFQEINNEINALITVAGIQQLSTNTKATDSDTARALLQRKVQEIEDKIGKFTYFQKDFFELSGMIQTALATQREIKAKASLEKTSTSFPPLLLGRMQKMITFIFLLLRRSLNTNSSNSKNSTPSTSSPVMPTITITSPSSQESAHAKKASDNLLKNSDVVHKIDTEIMKINSLSQQIEELLDNSNKPNYYDNIISEKLKTSTREELKTEIENKLAFHHEFFTRAFNYLSVSSRLSIVTAEISYQNKNVVVDDQISFESSEKLNILFLESAKLARDEYSLFRKIIEIGKQSESFKFFDIANTIRKIMEFIKTSNKLLGEILLNGENETKNSKLNVELYFKCDYLNEFVKKFIIRMDNVGYGNIFSERGSLMKMQFNQPQILPTFQTFLSQTEKLLTLPTQDFYGNNSPSPSFSSYFVSPSPSITNKNLEANSQTDDFELKLMKRDLEKQKRELTEMEEELERKTKQVLSLERRIAACQERKETQRKRKHSEIEEESCKSENLESSPKKQKIENSEPKLLNFLEYTSYPFAEPRKQSDVLIVNDASSGGIK